MRRAAAILLGAAALAAGCQPSDDPPADLPVTIPPPSATVATTAGSTAPTTAATAAAPPAKGPPPSVPAETPAAAYRRLAGDWQAARSAFFTAVSDGRRRTPAQQHALAAAYLAGSRRFAAGLRATRWPARVQPAVRALLAVNAAQQTHLVAMTTAPSAGAFTGRLADYGVAAAREDAAVAAVRVALG